MPSSSQSRPQLILSLLGFLRSRDHLEATDLVLGHRVYFERRSNTKIWGRQACEIAGSLGTHSLASWASQRPGVRHASDSDTNPKTGQFFGKLQQLAGVSPAQQRETLGETAKRALARRRCPVRSSRRYESPNCIGRHIVMCSSRPAPWPPDSRLSAARYAPRRA